MMITPTKVATLSACASPARRAPTSRALWFGQPEARLFGWFHPAEGARPSDAVVVLCNPFGYDAVATHFGHQKLAEHLSQSGVSAFRFDYFGTGDSAGDDEGPNRVATWLANIEEAVAEAKRQSGARKVILFGARLGALLATTYAQTNPVDGLIVMGPSRSGAVFVREMFAMNKMRAAKGSEAASPDIEYVDDESLGFPFPAELREALKKIDPRTSDACPAPRAMVIARDDIPGPEQGLVEHLRTIGVAVEHSHARGYTDLFGDSKALPVETADAIVSWLRSLPLGRLSKSEAARARSWPARTGLAGSVATFDGVTEEAVRFGGGLFGIWTEPPAGTPRRETAILLLGSGATHHVGMNRMHTPFARAMARRGFRVLRFDLSGIGESPTRPGERERWIYTPQSIPETRTAIDFAMARGCKAVAMTGLCSGGYTAFHTAAIDPRVVAIAPINVPTYHFNAGDSLVLAAHRPASPWKPPAITLPITTSFQRARVPFSGPALFVGPKQRHPSVLPRTGSLVEDPDDVARAFGGALARGCKALMIYGSGDPGRLALESHLGPGLAKARGDERLTLALVDGCDHTVTPRIAQKRVHALVAEFFDRVV